MRATRPPQPAPCRQAEGRASQQAPPGGRGYEDTACARARAGTCARRCVYTCAYARAQARDCLLYTSPSPRD
eukprot:12997533-Alexandrium_andersonii.AAC.1